MTSRMGSVPSVPSVPERAGHASACSVPRAAPPFRGQARRRGTLQACR